VGIQQRSHKRRRRVESVIYHQRRTVRAPCHVLWSHQLPSHLPDNDECNFRGRVERELAHHLHGRHPNPHTEQPTPPPPESPSDLGQTGKTRSLPEGREVPVRTKPYRVSGSHPRERNHSDGPSQNERGGGLAKTPKSQRRAIILRLYRILPLLHPQLLTHRPPPHRPHKESHGISLGRDATESVRNNENAHVFATSAPPTRLQQTLLSIHRRLTVRRGSRTLTGG